MYTAVVYTSQVHNFIQKAPHELHHVISRWRPVTTSSENTIRSAQRAKIQGSFFNDKIERTARCRWLDGISSSSCQNSLASLILSALWEKRFYLSIFNFLLLLHCYNHFYEFLCFTLQIFVFLYLMRTPEVVQGKYNVIIDLSLTSQMTLYFRNL